MCKACGDGKGSESSRLMGNNGAEREKRATSCKQQSLNSGSFHRNPFQPPTRTLQRPPSPAMSNWALHCGLRWNQMKLPHSRIRPVSDGQMRLKCREEIELLKKERKKRNSNDHDFHGRWKAKASELPAGDKGEQWEVFQSAFGYARTQILLSSRDSFIFVQHAQQESVGTAGVQITLTRL